jgi:hypothetical protein
MFTRVLDTMFIIITRIIASLGIERGGARTCYALPVAGIVWRANGTFHRFREDPVAVRSRGATTDPFEDLLDNLQDDLARTCSTRTVNGDGDLFLNSTPYRSRVPLVKTHIRLFEWPHSNWVPNLKLLH